MVRKTSIIPPVFPFAVSALAVLYAGVFFLPPAPALRAGVGACVIMACLASAGYSAIRAPAFRFSLCVVCGILAGLLCALRVGDGRLPVSGLAPRDDIAGLTVELLGDPAPWGEGRYRAQVRVLAAHTANGASYSASGESALFLPAAFVRSTVPGGIAPALRGNQCRSATSVPRAARGADLCVPRGAEPCAAGRVLRMEGAFLPYDPSTGERFNASCEASRRPQRAWVSPLHRIRASLRVSLARVLYDWGDSGGFLLALFAGNRDYLDPLLADAFRRTGLSHVLALSGMHLSIMAVIAVRAGKRLGGKRVSVGLSLAAVLLFVWFAGGSPSLNRSLIMILLAMLFTRLGYGRSMLPVLAATAAIQTLASPAEALSLAFMLSYAALWGILAFGPSVSRIFEGRLPDGIRNNLSSSVGAQILTVPVCAFATGCIAPVGVLASLVVSPLSTVFLVCGMAMILPASAFPVLSPACGRLLGLLYRATAGPVSLFARIPPLTLRDLPQTIAASIMAGMVGAFVLLAATASRSRRDPDDSFTRL